MPLSNVLRPSTIMVTTHSSESTIWYSLYLFHVDETRILQMAFAWKEELRGISSSTGTLSGTPDYYLLLSSS